MVSGCVVLVNASLRDSEPSHQVGTTSGYEREQEEFMAMCGPGVIWKCFGRDQARAGSAFILFASHCTLRFGL